jgi:hypothetical protein
VHTALVDITSLDVVESRGKSLDGVVIMSA